MQKLHVREMILEDVPHLTNYWTTASPTYLEGMGADASKMPTKLGWESFLTESVLDPYPQKKAYYTIWEIEGESVGHCNVNLIQFGKEAFMHLHLWQPIQRGQGIGRKLVQQSIPFFFRNLQLKTLYCQPFSQNPAPNAVLPKAGFTFVKKYTTIPGPINFEQEVNLYQISNFKF